MFDELELKYDARDKGDFFTLATLLCLYVKYPSTESSRQHRDANKLGVFDLKEEQQVEEE